MNDDRPTNGNPPTDAELARLERLSRAARESTSAEAPLGFASRVMARIEAEGVEEARRSEPVLARIFGWWNRPALRLASGLAALALLVWAVRVVMRPEPGESPAPQLHAESATGVGAPESGDGSTIAHRFTIEAPDARRVCLVGDFNDWKVCEVPLTLDPETKNWSVQMELPPGRHEYMFVVDEGWVTDPSATVHVDDGFGNRNAVIFL